MRHKDSRPQRWPIYQRGRITKIRRLPTVDLSVPPKPSSGMQTAGERMTYMAHYRLCEMEQPGRGVLRVLD